MSKQRKRVKNDDFLLDDPGGSAIEWLDGNVLVLREAVRSNAVSDPWDRCDHAAENDALTERRRRKLQSLSMAIDHEFCDERGTSVA